MVSQHSEHDGVLGCFCIAEHCCVNERVRYSGLQIAEIHITLLSIFLEPITTVVCSMDVLECAKAHCHTIENTTKIE